MQSESKAAETLPLSTIIDENNPISVEDIDTLLNSETLTAAELVKIAKICQNHYNDSLRALNCYQKACELGSSEAAYYLGDLYEIDDVHRPKNLELAFNYYLKAAKSGHKEALKPLERLAAETSVENQLLVSNLYGAFFHNPRKAQYWHNKASDVQQYHF